MCEQSQGVLNLYLFAEMERGVEAMDTDREPLVGSEQVIHRLMQEYDCDCQNRSNKFWTPQIRW